MPNPPNQLGLRDQQILCGLFLSKFDQDGLAYLGFRSFTEAFNTLGYGLGTRPATIKNYRDELDPYLSSTRRGWDQRPVRRHTKRILDLFSAAGIEETGQLIKRLLWPACSLRDAPETGDILRRFDRPDSSFARRLMTGKAAEAYFIQNHSRVPDFTGLSLTDTTEWGCGFDFKLESENEAPFVAVEVKGMSTPSGQIQLTALEYAMAETLADRFYLYVVRNFSEQPFHSVFRNPLSGGLNFERIERAETRVSWQTRLT